MIWPTTDVDERDEPTMMTITMTMMRCSYDLVDPIYWGFCLMCQHGFLR